MNAVKKFRDNIDWTTVTSLLVASAVIGGTVYGLRQVGLGKVANVVKGG